MKILDLICLLAFCVAQTSTRSGGRSGSTFSSRSSSSRTGWLSPSRTHSAPSSYQTTRTSSSSSSSGHNSWPSKSSHSSSSGSSSNTKSGWQTSRQTHPGQHLPTLSKPAQAPTPNYGWKTPASQHGQSSSQVPHTNQSKPVQNPTANSGWKTPASQHGQNPSQVPHTNQSKPVQNPAPNYGWKTPASQHGQSSSQVSHTNQSKPVQAPTANSGWKTPASQHGQNPSQVPHTNQSKPVQNPAPNYGWKTPASQHGQSSSQVSHTNQSKPVQNPTANLGWKIPASQHGQNPSQVSHTDQLKPVQTPTANSGWKTPASQPGQSSSQVSHTDQSKPVQNPTTNYGWQMPQQRKSHQDHIPTNQPVQNFPAQPPFITNQGHTNQPKTIQNPINNYETGRKYENGYGHGYDQGYQRGLQQGAKIPNSYYPPTNAFGYPGQGITHATYQGYTLHGAPSNFGYSVNHAYGYGTYGTGNSEFLKGAALGYLLNSEIHSAQRPHLYSIHTNPIVVSNPWGIHSGYGSDYHYTTVEKTTIINNYFNNSTPANANSNGNGWIDCIAFDPIARETYINPNCSCTVTTNTSVALHDCTTTWGDRRTEEVPIIKDTELFDPNRTTVKVARPVPEKIIVMDGSQTREENFYQALEIFVNMGNFS